MVRPCLQASQASLERGRDVLQRLVGELFSLPSESDVNGRYVQLPKAGPASTDANCKFFGCKHTHGWV